MIHPPSPSTTGPARTGWRGPRRLAAEAARRPRVTFLLGAVLLLWIILVINPQWFLRSRGAPNFVVRVQSMLPLAVLVGVLLFQWHRIRVLWPLLAYAAFVIGYWRFGNDPLLAEPHGKEMVVALTLAIGTLTLVRHQLHVRSIVLLMLLYRFAWFGLIGVWFGRVRYDPYLGNEDAYGATMAAGVVAAGAVALAATDRRLRLFATGVALLSMAGLISSFARGAFLVAALSIGLLWIRAEGRRLAYATFIVLAAVTTVIVGSSFTGVSRGRHGGLAYWSELATVTDDIADSEAEDRRLIWNIGWQVFKDNKAVGTGPGAWSYYACENYSGPILGERFSRRRDRLCGRAMHNWFYERLAELGFVGTGLFLWMLIDYWRRIVTIRRNTPKEDTAVLPGLRTKMIATSFEVSMVAFLTAGLLYNVVRISFYGLVIANALFHRAWLRQQKQRARAQPRARPTARPVVGWS